MKRLARAVRQKKVGGKPLPTVFWGMRKHQIRRGEVSMIAGQSNAGKSMFMLWHLIQWVTQDNLMGIYMSADSAELGQASRLLAMSKSNLTYEEAEALLDRRNQEGVRMDPDPWAVEQIAKLNNLVWSFEDDLSYENINEEVEAFAELWGRDPDFIVVDNLTDVEGQSEDEWATQRRALKALTQLARKTDAAVIVLHHTSEDDRIKEEPCPPRKAILGKCSQKPSLILTVANLEWVAAVKDRYAKCDKSGHTALHLSFNPNTLHYTEM